MKTLLTLVTVTLLLAPSLRAHENEKDKLASDETKKVTGEVLGGIL